MNKHYALKHFDFIEVSGSDAANYLQGQTSCDIHKLEPGQAMMGCCCNLKGRVQSLFYVFHHKNKYILAISSGLIKETLARLKQYAMFSKVTIERSAQTFAAYGLKGNKDLSLKGTGSISSISFSIEDKLLIFIFGLKSNIEAQLQGESQMLEQWNTELILAGIPQLNHLSYEKFLPQELNLDKLGALDFEKGCYTGQEVVARLHYRGGLKQHLCAAQIDSLEPISTYAEIHNSNQQRIGHVVNSATWQNQQALLAVIRDEAKEDAWINGKKATLVTGLRSA